MNEPPKSGPRRPRTLPVRADVVVIGAGAAGVFAMRELVRTGFTAICVEARNRIGGRIFTRRSLARHPIELGAEFVHGEDNIVHELSREYGLTLVPHVGEAYSWFDGQLLPDSELPRPPQSLLHELRRLAEHFRRAGRGAAPLSVFLSTPECAEILARSAVTRRYIEQLIKNDHSVEPTVLTLEGWLEPDVSGFEANFHVDEGYSALLHRATEAGDLDIRLNRPVHRIEWEPGTVSVFARNLKLESRAALVTLPLGVLQQSEVIFDEPLPSLKIDAIHALQAGKAFKMVTSFRALRRGKSFWPEGMAFLTSALDSQLHWPTSPRRRRGQRHLLSHLVGGDAADRFGHHPDPPQAMLSQLVHMFGNERIRDLFVRAEWRAWHDDRYSRSGYSALPDETVPDAREALGMPVADTLFFAGEAVGVKGKPGNVASVHGAIESGIQGARDLIASLRS
ncbi:MAG TPA: NAD(P)/FAD-dependent oxidoreductase [Planctomycetaceae bacterium]|nr:NAD(P)/FAD-dependent oxidoreductase [Planctomycetaceae bacterium]